MLKKGARSDKKQRTSVTVGSSGASSSAATFDQQVKAWFKQYADPDDETQMGGEGIEKLFSEMELSMESVHPFLLAWKVNAQRFGTFRLQDFMQGLRPHAITDTMSLKSFLVANEMTIYPDDPAPMANSQFKQFYTFLFPYLREEGQKSLRGEIAQAVWSIVLVPKFPLANSFIEFTQSPESSFRGVSSDTWNQLYEFLASVGNDLSGYSEEEAWPAILDEFVEWHRKNNA